MVHFPTRVGALVVHGAMRGRGCRESRARLRDCVGVEGGRTGARRRPGVPVVLLGVRASEEASPTRASDARQSSGNLSVHARAGAGVDAGVGVGAGAGADVDVDVGVDADVGAYGCENAGGGVRGYDHADVGSLLCFVVVVEAALACPEEGESDDGCAGADAGALANGSGDMDCHARAHMALVHAGGVHRDQDAMALVPMYIFKFINSPKMQKTLPVHKGSPHATTRHQACVVRVLAQWGECNPSHRVDGAPSLEDLFPFPALYPSPSRVDASSRN